MVYWGGSLQHQWGIDVAENQVKSQKTAIFPVNCLVLY